MQKLVLYSALSLILFVACSKDKFQDAPSVTIKSITPTQVPLQSSMVMELEFTDKQGDVDSIFLIKSRLNSVQVPVLNNFYLPFKLPDFPEKTKGDIKITLTYNEYLVTAQKARNQPGAPNDREPDTLNFKIVLKDKSGNVGDTVITDNIVVERFN
ncbi:hypothetical protein FAM09_29100 [Niastella caeni]|uniref:Uncharacterized protein n=1 Tax=Niastella caeni TaxID=2569763 RepID=A0A4S8HEU1_9BACT|nr:hypothetical protein [Niastella caeni]THU31142.1 hypothetical protein FAM09_29100 [Niastella caeni]